MATLIALTLQNLFGRHPQVKIVSIENGSNWLKPLFKTIDKAAALGRRGPMIGGKLSPDPARPPEGLREPRDYIGQLTGCDPDVTRKVLRGNTAELLGLTDRTPALP